MRLAVLCLSLVVPALAPAACAVRAVCGACAYTSIASALAAAGPCDTVELWEDRAEEVVLDRDVAEIRGLHPGIVWSGSGGSPTLELRSGMNRALHIHGITLSRGGGNGRILDWDSVGPLASLEIGHAVVRQDTNADGVRVRESLGPAGRLLVHHTSFLGSAGAKNALLLQNQSAAGAVLVANCLFYRWDRGLDCNDASAAQVLALHNNTFDSLGTAALRIQCRGSFINNLFTGNSDDLQLAGPADPADFSANAFAQADEALGPSNLTGIVRADQYVDAGTDFRLKASAGVRNLGAPLAQVLDDLGGLPRPREGAHDIGCHEYQPWPTPTPSPGVEVAVVVRDRSGAARRTLLCRSDHLIVDFKFSRDPFDADKGPLLLSDGGWWMPFDGRGEDGLLLPNDTYVVEVSSGRGGQKATATRGLTLLSSREAGARVLAVPALLLPGSAECTVLWEPAGPAEISVYSLSGERLRSYQAGPGQGRLGWDLKNASGQPAANGLYLVAVRPEGQRRPQFAKICLRR